MPVVEPPVETPPRTKPETDSETKLLPPYNVILLNDDDHSMEFVVDVLRKVFAFPVERCVQLMLEAHTTGRAVVWTGSKEVAELKVEQIRTFHEIRDRDKKKLGPLDCLIEPAPG
jgi:ATP-dependent Clp protease adaptor protein ClpS